MNKWWHTTPFAALGWWSGRRDPRWQVGHRELRAVSQGLFAMLLCFPSAAELHGGLDVAGRVPLMASASVLAFGSQANPCRDVFSPSGCQAHASLRGQVHAHGLVFVVNPGAGTAALLCDSLASGFIAATVRPDKFPLCCADSSRGKFFVPAGPPLRCGLRCGAPGPAPLGSRQGRDGRGLGNHLERTSS